jgi:polar amino acid transport system ATP-binding protein
MNTPTPTTMNEATSEEQSFRGSSLELRNLTMAYGDIEVLRTVSLTVAPGTTTCIIGP